MVATPRASGLTVCFVGSAVTGNPARVAEIVSDLRWFEWFSGVKFRHVGTCQTAQTTADNLDYYPEDIRLRIRGSNVTVSGTTNPGRGCTMKVVSSSFGGYPNEDVDHHCLFNGQLWDDADPTGDPWLNHSLHEIGHMLGLGHEHLRSDLDFSKFVASAQFPNCKSSSRYDKSLTGVFLTPYDSRSVMHYANHDCGVDGNYGTEGLSSLDQMAFHILYPEPQPIAEISGRFVVPHDQPQIYDVMWLRRGASLSVLKRVEWYVDGTLRATANSGKLAFIAGTHSLRLRYVDVLDRTYDTSYRVTALTPLELRKRLSAVGAATSALLH
jgi:hypothetical protein